METICIAFLWHILKAQALLPFIPSALRIPKILDIGCGRQKLPLMGTYELVDEISPFEE